MKVILKVGIPKKDDIRKIECVRCGCEFSYDHREKHYVGSELKGGDIQYSTNSGIPYGDPYVVCPQDGCAGVIYVTPISIGKKIAMFKTLLSEIAKEL